MAIKFHFVEEPSAVRRNAANVTQMKFGSAPSYWMCETCKQVRVTSQGESCFSCRAVFIAHKREMEIKVRRAENVKNIAILVAVAILIFATVAVFAVVTK